MRYPVNSAKALGVRWQDLIDPEWEQWEPYLRGKELLPLPERRAEPDPFVRRI